MQGNNLKLSEMASELDNLFESDDDDKDYEPSEKELHEMNKDEFNNSKKSDDPTDLKEKNTFLRTPFANGESTRTDELWKDFLSDQTNGLKTLTSHKSNDIESNTSSLISHKLSIDIESNKIENLEQSKSEKAVSIVKVLDQDYAVHNDSEVLKIKEFTHPSLPKKRRTGLPMVFESIKNKKFKETTLQKSLSDWNHFKKDEGIEEDLRNFNRGKGGFLNRKAFLERSDFRSFEIERAVRLSKK